MSTDKKDTATSSLPHDRDSHRSIIKSTTVFSLGTMVSRVLGFIRDVLFAKILGTGMGADAFFVAFKIPNLFRDMVGEGATNAAVVPVMSHYYEEKDKESFDIVFSVIFIRALIFVSAIVILGIIFSPLLVRLIVPGFISNPTKLELTITLNRLLFPYLIFIGLTAYCIGVLFTTRAFGEPAFSPCLMNLAIIGCAILSFYLESEPVYILSVGVLLGGAFQLWWNYHTLTKKGIKLIMPKSLQHPGAQKIGRLLMPRMIGSGVYQLNIFVDTFCASISSIVGLGGIAAITYANRIMHLPIGIFGVALASAVLPSFSGFNSRKDYAAFKKMLLFSLENIFFIMCPISVFFILFSEPIIKLLFERGEFDMYSTGITSTVLAFSSIGLISYGATKILTTAFYAMHDTKTPVKVAGICLLVNAAFNVLLMFPLKIAGIALASSIAGAVNFVILLFLINKKLGGLERGLSNFMVKIFFASVLMGLVAYIVFIETSSLKLFYKMIFIGVISFLVYEAACYLLKIKQATESWRLVTRWILKKQ